VAKTKRIEDHDSEMLQSALVCDWLKYLWSYDVVEPAKLVVPLKKFPEMEIYALMTRKMLEGQGEWPSRALIMPQSRDFVEIATQEANEAIQRLYIYREEEYLHCRFQE